MMTTWRGNCQVPGRKGHQGQSPLPPSFQQSPVQKQARRHFREYWCFHQVCLPRGLRPNLSSSPQSPLLGCTIRLRFLLLLMAGSLESNYFSQGSAIQSSGRGERVGVEKPRKPSRPHRLGSPYSDSSGRGEASLEGARDAASGTICPSACGSSSGAPASFRLSGRLAKGFPRRAPRANRRRRAGLAPGSPHSHPLIHASRQHPPLAPPQPAHAPRAGPHARFCSGPSTGRAWTLCSRLLDAAL